MKVCKICNKEAYLVQVVYVHYKSRGMHIAIVYISNASLLFKSFKILTTFVEAKK
jgi:hypothetical protein